MMPMPRALQRSTSHIAVQWLGLMGLSMQRDMEAMLPMLQSVVVRR